MKQEPGKSPNPKIDKAIESLMRKLEKTTGDDVIDPETAVKIINSAVAWEKVKHHITDNGGGGFNPDDL